MAPNQTDNKLLVIFAWLTSTWAAAISAILIIAGTIFGAGYWSGCYVTNTESKYQLMNLRLDHQKEISDLKDKAKEDAINELKEKNQQSEKIYSILMGGGKNEK